MNNQWLCIDCGTPLGTIIGGELSPASGVPSANVRTRGPNLVITCPNCGAAKTFYTADPLVRATNQFVAAMADAIASRTLFNIGDETRNNATKKS